MRKINEVRKISSLKAWRDNPKTVEPEDLERLKTQIKELGVYKPLIILADGTVLGGNQRLAALKELKEKHAWVNVVTAKTKKEKVEIALSDNDASGQWENGEVVELLSNMGDLAQFKDYMLDAGFLLDLKIDTPRGEDKYQAPDDKLAYETSEVGQIALYLTLEQKEMVEAFVEREMAANDFEKKESVLLSLLENYENTRRKKK